MTITCMFSCDACGVRDIKFEVEARTTEDVIVWMKQKLTIAVGKAHFKMSPYCSVSKLTNVKIPITGASKIGGVLEN